MPKFDRKKMSEDLKKSMKKSYDSKDQGLFGSSIFKSNIEIPFWKCGEGRHLLDIIPYVSGSHNTMGIEEGEWAHYLDIWVHYRVGASDDAFVCLSKNWKEPCPICEYRKELESQEDHDDEQLKALMPKRRSVYNIVVRDGGKEEKKGVQVWDVAYFFMEQNLQSIAQRPRTGGSIDYSHPDNGKQIQFERKGTGATNTKFQGHVLVDREDYQISDEELEQAYALDDIITIPTYDQINNALHGSKASLKKEADTEKVDRKINRNAGKGKEQEREEKEQEENECPAKGVFGQDVGQLDHCSDCDIYDECADEFDRLESIAAEKRKASRRLRR